MNNIILLYDKVAKDTVPKLARLLGEGVAVIERADAATVGEHNWLIRYGCTARIPHAPRRGVLNGVDRRRKYSNRIQQLSILAQAGVPVVPVESLPLRAIALAVKVGANSVLARMFPEGEQPTQGKGIEVFSLQGLAIGVLSGEGWAKWHMYSPLLPKARQFRVHVVRSATRVTELIPGDREAHIWTHEAGKSVNPTSPVPPVLIEDSVRAVAALGLDFGGVDVLVTPEGRHFILEVNTAPGLFEPSRQWYAQQFLSILNAEAVQ